MASSKNAHEITLLSFENTPSLNSGDFSGLYATLSASCGECSYSLNTLDDGFSVSTEFRSPLETEIDALALRARDIHALVSAGDLNSIDTSNHRLTYI